ncbi:hypothetical protein [Niallia sp. Man26]|uniref:hypothetical protein n=1 Tax=Niallia sp. Man26 TaxID=2912824 RepID=UPI001EDB8824|nr:hypothetical protein [Niallia sp. Man26]UPO88322.1 hypothetical protein L8T27_003910 [Niallia sp. Man26]
MNDDSKLVAGKILGEIYRVQKQQGICSVSDSTIFGLLNGFQEAIESEIDGLNFVSKGQVSVVCDALEPYFKEEVPLDELNFLDFRMELERKGISHGRLIDILKYLRASNSYSREIDKMGNYSMNSSDI